MSTTIRSALGEQTVQSQPIRTFTVPDASQDQFDPLPDNLPVFRGQAYQETPPQSSYNAPQPSRRSGMGSGSMGELKAQEEAMARARVAKVSLLGYPLLPRLGLTLYAAFPGSKGWWISTGSNMD